MKIDWDAKLRAPTLEEAIKIREGSILIDIIKFLQRSNINFKCFGTGIDAYCTHKPCLWRPDCKRVLSKGLMS